MAKSNRKLLYIILFAVAVIALLIFSIYFYVSSVISHIPKTPAPKFTGPMSISAYVNSEGVLSYNNSQQLVGYALVNYTTENVISANFSLKMYVFNPMPKIYFLNSTGECYQCLGTQSLYDNVSNEIYYYDMLNSSFSGIQMIGIQNISSIIPGSMIIIATGLMPTQLMQSSNSTLPIETLLNEGDTIVYVGENFSRLVGPNGVIFVNPPQTLSQLYLYGLGTMPSSSVELKKANPLNISISSPNFKFINGTTYGPLTYVNKYANRVPPHFNGTLVALPSTPASWGNPVSLAHDIAKVIYSQVWNPSLAFGYENISNVTNGNVGIFTLNKTMPNSQISEQQINMSYPLVSIVAQNSTFTNYYNIPFSIKYSANGTLSVPSILGFAEQTAMTIGMSTASSSKHLVVPHLDLFTDNMSYIESIPIGFFNTSSNINVIKYYAFNLPEGRYILLLRDFYNRYYSSAVFQVLPPEVKPVALNFANGTFIFSVYSNGAPVTNTTYSITLNGAYKQSGTLYGGDLYYSLPKGAIINYGNQVFTINMSRLSFSYSTSYIKKVFHIPAFYIEFAIVGIVVIALNLILKSPNRDEYYIDVPDFPPQKKSTVSVGKNDILAIFDKVNYYYHWRNMPLSIEEVKSGIDSNIRYNGMPIAVTVQNANLIMSNLIAQGEVEMAGGYYAPKKFIESSKHDIEYLAVFRKLRDYCISHAILFTEMDSSDIADAVISKSGVQAHVIIYSSISGMRSIRLVNGIKTFIVFIDEETKQSFLEKLYSSYGEEAEMLKIGISYSYIKLVSTNALDQLLF